jgi:hypothetical protein
MDELQAKAGDLANCVDDERRFLSTHGHAYLDERLERVSNLLREGEIQAGLKAFLLENRSIMDIQFHPVNGDATTEDEGRRLTAVLRAVHERSFELVRELEDSLAAK